MPFGADVGDCSVEVECELGVFVHEEGFVLEFRAEISWVFVMHYSGLVVPPLVLHAEPYAMNQCILGLLSCNLLECFAECLRLSTLLCTAELAALFLVGMDARASLHLVVWT